MKESTKTILLKTVAWVWIVGGIYKFLLTPFAWQSFSIERNIYNLIIKTVLLISGICLLNRKKFGAYLYFPTALINIIVFYGFPISKLHGTLYFSQQAIWVFIISMAAYFFVVSINWKTLK